MQNFTLRFKGKIFYLFAFSLFMVSMSSYGQCPTVSDSDQNFCYLATVSELQATPASGKTLRFFRTATSTNPIPNDELLENGRYFAGSQDNTCRTSGTRPFIDVTVDDLGAPTSTFGNFYEPCVYSMGDVTTVGELKDLIVPSDPSFDINVYAEEFGDMDDELNDTDVLVNGENYFIGQDNPADGDCRYSSRIAIEYNPVQALAPAAEPVQEFCESNDPTVGDLMATATDPNTQAFRWYSTETSQPPLTDDTPLVDGETYYASQIVNRTDSTEPPCESTERTMVTVSLIPSDAGPDNTDEIVCETAADDIFASTNTLRDFYLTLLENNFDTDTENDVPTDGTFSDESLAALVASYTGTGYYETTYTATFDATAGCVDDVVLAFTVEEDPNAGTDTELSYCQSDFQTLVAGIIADPSSAEAIFADLIDGADAGGTFSPSLVELANTYANAVATDAFPLTLVTTYTVTTGTTGDPGCTSSATFTLNILDDPDAGTDNTQTLCENEVETSGIFASETSLEAYFLNLLGTEDDRGTFNPLLSDLMLAYSDGVTVPSEDFTTTYTVAAGSCEPEMSTATLTVTAAIPAEAGTATAMTYCSNDDAINLSTLLTGANPDGVFSSPDADVTDGTFNPALGEGSYSITYTVSPETACVSNTATETFTVTVQAAPDAGSNATASFCETDADVMTAFANETSLETYLFDLLGTDDDSGDFNPLLSTLIANYNDGIVGAEDFSTTYTIAATTACDEVTSTVSLTVNEAVTAEAGTVDSIDGVCSNDEAINLADLLTDPTTVLGGTFSSNDTNVTDGSFDPATAGAGIFTITYTISEDDACVTGSASVDFTISVDEAPNAGPGGDFAFCQSEFEALAAQVAANPAGQGIELLNEFDATITPGGDFTNNTLAQLLAQYAATTTFPATFTTTYTVSNDDCTDAADYTVTINPNEDADAGDDQTVTYCTSNGMVDLAATVGAGTFTSDDLTITNGSMFDATATGAGTFTVTYTVDGSTNPCVTGTSTATITVVITPGYDLGDDVSTNVCASDLADDYFTVENLTAEFTALLPADAPDGTFSPAISSLVDNFGNGMTTGDFTTTYSIGTDECADSVVLTISVLETIDAELTEVANPDPICQNDDVQQLVNFIGDNIDRGSFEGYEDGTFDPSMMAAGDYEITYTLDEATDGCVNGSDSITFTITVLDAANAGDDVELTVCQSAGVQNLFDALTGDLTDEDGTFTVDGTEITDGMMNPSDFDAGVYTVLYTVTSDNDCGNDTATFTITVQEAPDAGEDFAYTVCANVDSLNLNSILDDDVTAGGTFEYDGNNVANGIITPGDFEPGDYTIGYILLNDDCSDIAVITLTVQDAANAGENMDITVCMSDDVQNLNDFISTDADAGGTFSLDGTEITDGLMNPAEFDAGTYTVIYTAAAINDCGEDTSEFTITVQDTPDAPTVTDQSFCAIDAPTVAGLVADGSNLTFYSDVELENMIDATTALTTGVYYVTQRASDDACESSSAMINVTINDAPTPTIRPYEDFCEFDDPTIQTISDLVNEAGVVFYDAATGGATISPSTALQDGVTYYASLTDATSGCASSVRLPVSVVVDECPLVIPEGFSPNGDQINDTFTIIGIEREYPNYSMEIHNRWGDMVYKGNDNTPDWDGYSDQSGFGSGLLPTGAYFYIIYFNDGSTPPVRGTVYLSR